MANRALWMCAQLFALILSCQGWAASFSEFVVPGNPDSILVLNDGTLILGDVAGDRLTRFFPATGQAIMLPLGRSQVRNVVLGADGRLWFTDDNQRFVGRYEFAREMLDLFPMPDNISGAIGGIVLGLEGSLWATASDSNRILRISPTGVMTTYDLASYDPHPIGIAQGPDGNIWFAERNAKKIGRVTSSGNVTEFTVPPQLTTGPSQIVRGSDGGLWFATDDGFGRVAINGEFTLFPTGPQTAAGRMVLASDGSFWLGNGDGAITQFTPPAGVSRRTLWPSSAITSGLVFDAAGNLFVTDSWRREYGRLAMLPRASAIPGDTAVIEFYNSSLKHYFITANAAEAAGIDAGAAGAGWSRTGETWPAWLAGPLPGATEVCRFYGNPALNPITGLRRGPNSHFYTFQGPECEQVKNDPGWVYEAPNKYFTVQPAAGQCPVGTLPISRLYNNGFAQNDSNHRYTTKTAIYNQMISQGWQGEGVVMCTAPAAP